MTETLGDLLRRGADTVPVPHVDLEGVVVGARRRQRRRRLAVVATAVTAVGAIAVGSVLISRTSPNTQGPDPVSPPSSSESSTVAVDPEGTRPLVYAEGSTVHVGDRTVEARKPVAFIAPTDDGAVYEASLDGTLWFTDGITTSVIGTSGYAAAPTAHAGVVTTGESGSLVVWADLSGRANQEPDEYLVYDTSRREVVERIPMDGESVQVIRVDDDRVYVSPQYGRPGCWVYDIHACNDPHLLRFDVSSGRTTKIRLAEMDMQTRSFRNGAGGLVVGFTPGFQQVGQRLLPTDGSGDPLALRTSSGEPVRLRLPPGFSALNLRTDGSVIMMSQWLDDDHVVVWANGGGGDLPPQQGDLLVCRLPDGACHVEVARSSHDYVAP